MSNCILNLGCCPQFAMCFLLIQLLYMHLLFFSLFYFIFSFFHVVMLHPSCFNPWCSSHFCRISNLWGKSACRPNAAGSTLHGRQPRWASDVNSVNELHSRCIQKYHIHILHQKRKTWTGCVTRLIILKKPKGFRPKCQFYRWISRFLGP